MDSIPQLDEALSLALRLTPGDRLRLAEQVIASVEREISPQQSQPELEEHWGQSLNRLLDQLDLSEWEALEIDDPVEWLKQLRSADENRHAAYWDGTK